MTSDYRAERRHKAAKLKEALEQMPKPERDFRQALAEAQDTTVTLDGVQREIHVTPYAGAYGLAGVVIAINGSPPRALVLATVDKGRSGATVVLFRNPSWAKRPLTCDQETSTHYKSGKRVQTRNATLAYLDSIGVFDDRGGRVLEFAPYVGPSWGWEND